MSDRDMVAKNYKYGLLAPIQNREKVMEQILLFHRYKNKMVEMERKRRRLWNKAENRCRPGLKEVNEELSSVRRLLKEVQAEQKEMNKLLKDRRKHVDLQARRKELKSKKKELDEKAKVIKSLAKTDEMKRWDEMINRAYSRVAKFIYSYSEEGSRLYWCNKVKHNRDFTRKGPPPKFKRYCGEGVIWVQLQAPEGVEKPWQFLFEENQLVKFEKFDPEIRTNKKGMEIPRAGEKKRDQYYRVWFRVGSQGKHKPVWAVFPLVLHRQPPIGSTVKWVGVKRSVMAGKEKWELIVTVKTPVDGGVKIGKSVSLDLGYRLNAGGGVRVGVLAGSDGKLIEVCVSPRIVRAIEKADHIRSVRDKMFNKMKAGLQMWVKGSDVPKWLKDEVSHLHLWKSPARMVSLIKRWSDCRFEGDELIWLRLVKWRSRDTHLWLYEAHSRDQAIASRLDYFRKVAKSLRDRYDLLVLEDLKLKEMLECGSKETKLETVSHNIRRVSRLASPGLFVRCLKEAFGEDGVEKVRASYTSKTCFVCKGLCEINGEVDYICEHCGSIWDRDENAAKNILARGLVALESRRSLDGVAWQRVTPIFGGDDPVAEGDKSGPLAKRDGGGLLVTT